MGMVLLEVHTGLLLDLSLLLLANCPLPLYGELLVKEVGRDVMHVDELDARLLHDLTVPFAVAAVATLYLAARPLIARRQRDEDGRGTLLATVVDHLLQIPAEGVDHLVGTVVELIDVQGVTGAGNDATRLLVGDGTDIVMAELDGHKVAGLQRVVHLLPQALADKRAGRASGTGGVHQRNLALVENGSGLRGPAPHSVIVLVGILHRRVASEEDNGLSLRGERREERGERIP